MTDKIPGALIYVYVELTFNNAYLTKLVNTWDEWDPNMD